MFRSSVQTTLRLLRGHDLHAQFTITSRLVGAVWRQVNQQPQSTPLDWHAKGFTTVFSQLMSQWAWSQSRPGVWHHETLGNISFLHPLQKLDLIQHLNEPANKGTDIMLGSWSKGGDVHPKRTASKWLVWTLHQKTRHQSSRKVVSG